MGGGLIIEANIPVQELEGQRGEGAYFREDTVHASYSVCVCAGVCVCSMFVSVTYVCACVWFMISPYTTTWCMYIYYMFMYVQCSPTALPEWYTVMSLCMQCPLMVIWLGLGLPCF